MYVIINVVTKILEVNNMDDTLFYMIWAPFAIILVLSVIIALFGLFGPIDLENEE